MSARGRWYADPGRLGLIALALSAAAFFLLPLYIMTVTSLKSMDEIRLGQLFAWPTVLTLDAWHAAWSTACTGVACEGIRGGFWNSVAIVLPSTMIAIALGALNGYALAFWRARGAALLVRRADDRRLHSGAGADVPAGTPAGPAPPGRLACRASCWCT